MTVVLGIFSVFLPNIVVFLSSEIRLFIHTQANNLQNCPYYNDIQTIYPISNTTTAHFYHMQYSQSPSITFHILQGICIFISILESLWLCSHGQHQKKNENMHTYRGKVGCIKGDNI